MAVAIALTGLGAAQLILAIGDGGDPSARIAGWEDRRGAVAQTESGHKVLYDEWNERISSETFWRNNRRSGSSNSSGKGSFSSLKTPPSRLQGPPPSPGWFIAPGSAANVWGEPDEPRSSPRSSPRSYSGYRTICVRTCDGYFFPVSFSTSEGNLSRDQASCSNACPGARLYYSRAHTDEIDDMVDLSGQRYSKLPNAKLFRTQYVESCKCKPHAWEAASLERHKIYALEDRRRKGDRSVVAELEELKTKRQIEQRVMRGNRKSSRARKRSDERASLVPPATIPVTSAAAPAPRSDVSRGQGRARAWQRYAVAAVTTGSIGAQRTVNDTAALTVPLPGRSQLSVDAAATTAADFSATSAIVAATSAGAFTPAIAPSVAAPSSALPNPTYPQAATTGVAAASPAVPAAAVLSGPHSEQVPQTTVTVPPAPALAVGTNDNKPIVEQSVASDRRSAKRLKAKARPRQPAGNVRVGAAPRARALSRTASASTPGWVRQVFSY